MRILEYNPFCLSQLPKSSTFQQVNYSPFRTNLFHKIFRKELFYFFLTIFLWSGREVVIFTDNRKDCGGYFQDTLLNLYQSGNSYMSDHIKKMSFELLKYRWDFFFSSIVVCFFEHGPQNVIPHTFLTLDPGRLCTCAIKLIWGNTIKE